MVLTDNGTEFVNRTMAALSAKIGFRQVTTPLYHPQADSVERVNRVVRTMMISFIEADHREWDVNLPNFRFAHNTAYHSSIQTSPAFLNFGHDPTPAVTLRRVIEGEPELVHQPTELWKERMQAIDHLRASIVHALDAAFQKQSRYYDLRRRDRQFELNDLVWKKYRVLSDATKFFTAKLTPAYHGPFRISRKISRVVYELSDLNGRFVGKYSVQDLKPYYASLGAAGTD